MAHENGAHDNAKPASVDGTAGSELAVTLQLNALTGNVADLARARTPLSERIVALPPSRLMEAFRTKLKLKAPTSSATAAADDQHSKLTSAHDDLTRIRGITPVMAGRLTAVGVTHFAQIAAWEQPDVQSISQALDLGRTISRQNWIEQAALLARSSTQATQPPAQTVVNAAANSPSVISAIPMILVQLPPHIPVPEVSEFVAPDVAAAAAPLTELLLPRVVPVDASGDAKFHHAVVHFVEANTRDAARREVAMLPPVVPVPVVAEVSIADVIRPTFQTSALTTAEAAAAAAAVVTFVTPFEVPVPVVPELHVADAIGLRVAPEHATAALPALPPSLQSDQQIVDDTLATQLHATVAAVADDRAVAATIDLLSAFSPPPVADNSGVPDRHPWPPQIPVMLAGVSQLQRDNEVEADIAFTRWVPTTPITAPVPPRRGEAVETRSPMPWSRAGLQRDGHVRAANAVDVRPLAAPAPAAQPTATMRAVATAVAAPAAGTPPLVPSVRTPRETALPQPEQVGPQLEPAMVEVGPMVPLEPVAPSMLDRLASLEAELSALAANDRPRAHAATPSVPMSAYRVGTLLPTAPPPPVPQRAGAQSAAANVPQLPDPVGRAILDGGEADVMIVARQSDPLEIHSSAPGPGIGTLEQRMRRARPAPEVDVETYAGYHGAISEASVEIVRRDTQTRAVVFDDSSDVVDDGKPRSREGTVRKFLNALKGDAN